jgi:hypothetical protein
VNGGRLNRVGLPSLLAGLVLAASLTADAAAAHTVSQARWIKAVSRAALVTRSGELPTTVRRTSGQSWGGWGGTNSRGGGPAGWPGTRLTGLTGNQQGYSVAIALNSAVVSAPGVKEDTGVAYFWHKRGGSWRQVLTESDPRHALGDQYAWAVAEATTKTTTYVVIGGNDINGRPDRVYIYAGSGKIWRLQATITDPGGNSGDMFGDSVAMSATTLVIGASCQKNFIGAAYIYQRSGSTWKLAATKKSPVQRANYYYGQSVAVSGNRVIVTAENISEAGAAYVYTRTPAGSWPLTATISNPIKAREGFGLSSALSGTTAVIGAWYYNTYLGAAYVYKLEGTTWKEEQRLTPPVNGGEFGFSTAMTATTVLIGEPSFDDPGLCGTAYAFKLSGGKWVVSKHIEDPDCTTEAGFGYSVAISGKYGAFGAPYTNNGEGASYELPIG